MYKHDSVLLDLRNLLEVEAKDKNYFSHMILGLEVNEDGTPIGAVVKMKCSPVLALGVIDLLHQRLDEAREQVLRELESYEKAHMTTEESGDVDSFENMMKNAHKYLSDDDKEFFQNCQKRALDALMKNDEDTLKSIIAEMRAYVDNKKKGGSNSGFNLNDFKGGF